MNLLTTTGNSADFLSRIKKLLPRGWFGNSSTPVLDAVLSGPAALFAGNYTMLVYVANQTRIRTATGPNLDLISQDFFNGKLPRLPEESDANFRARILANLFISGPARRDLIAVLTEITGKAPQVIEPMNATDCGGWDLQFGWDSGGAWGDRLVGQSFVTAYRPSGTGIPYVDGWDNYAGGWDTPSQIEWTDASQVQNAVTDAAIYAALAANKPAGTRTWARILSAPITLPVTPTSQL